MDYGKVGITKKTRAYYGTGKEKNKISVKLAIIGQQYAVFTICNRACRTF